MSDYKLAYEPTMHQLEDSDTLVTYEDGLLWADPGTGKTFTAIMAIAQIDVPRVVVVCPKIALDMWKEEIEKHLGWKAYVMRSGVVRKGTNIFWCRAWIVSYDLLARNKNVQERVRRYARGYVEFRSTNQRLPNKVVDAGGKFPSLLLCDEAHYLKTASSLRTKKIFGEDAHLKMGLRSYFGEVWQLTGTPVTRHADDLWVPLQATRREILAARGIRSYNDFVDRFCRTEWKKYSSSMQKTRVVVGSKNLNRLEELLTECRVIRRKLKDVVDDLPPITYRPVSVSYKNVENVTLPPGGLAGLMRELNRPDSGLSKVRRKLGIAKVSDSANYLLETQTYESPTLVGFWHIDVGHALREALEDNGFNVGYIDGSTGQKERERTIAAFNSGRMHILLGQIKAMGVAANLQNAADRVVLVEEVLSQADFDQFVARVYRRGQKRHVQVDLLRSDHDLDAAMLGVRLRKAEAAAKVF